MNGHENLIPLTERPEEEQREIRIKGAQAANAVRKQKKAMREVLSSILGLRSELTAEEIEQLTAAGLTLDEIDNQAKMLMQIFYKAASGDIKAAEFIRDTAGEKPTDNSNVAHSFDGDVVVSMKRNDEA